MDLETLDSPGGGEDYCQCVFYCSFNAVTVLCVLMHLNMYFFPFCASI